MNEPMNEWIDLHCHSNCSDGTDSPEELARLAGELKLAAVALTDHDNVRGIPAFLNAGKAFPETEYIPGVELSTLYGSRELHVVGLYIDPENPVLLDFLAEMRQERLVRNLSMAKKLASLGYPVDFSLLPVDTDDSIGRPHFARYLVEHYQFQSLQQVFDKFLKHSCAAYTPRLLPLPSRAIAAIKAAGGAAIWAHPVYRERRGEAGFVRRMIRKLAPFGLDGLECYYSMFGVAETTMLLQSSGNAGLAASGGSDYHGNNSPNIALGAGAGGLRVPKELLTQLKIRAATPFVPTIPAVQ